LSSPPSACDRADILAEPRIDDRDREDRQLPAVVLSPDQVEPYFSPFQPECSPSNRPRL